MGPVLAFQQRFICLLKCLGNLAQCGFGNVILILGFALAAEGYMNVALILVSLGIANAPEPLGGPLMVAYFEDMKSCVAAANQAQLPVAGIPGRSLNTWAQFVCVPAKPIVP